MKIDACWRRKYTPNCGKQEENMEDLNENEFHSSQFHSSQICFGIVVGIELIYLSVGKVFLYFFNELI